MMAKITLWGMLAECFDFDFYEKNLGPFIHRLYFDNLLFFLIKFTQIFNRFWYLFNLCENTGEVYPRCPFNSPSYQTERRLCRALGHMPAVLSDHPDDPSLGFMVNNYPASTWFFSEPGLLLLLDKGETNIPSVTESRVQFQDR